MAVQHPTLAEGSGGGPASKTSEFTPYVPDGSNIPEMTWSAVLLGVILGIIFGASSLYLVLRVGLTVSASIPVAVLSITVFRALSKMLGTRHATILENNIVQTTGSAGESIAFGVGVTMPALMILGYDMELTRVMLVACLGGLLGILMMIPLRRAFVVKQHGELPYPEGTACAQVLIVGEQGGSSAKTVFAGFGLAFFYQSLMEAMKLWQQYPTKALHGFKGAFLSLDASPALLGVGYIIGFRISSVMVAGGLMAAFVLTPETAFFGGAATSPVFPGTKLISKMSPSEIRNAYVLYIGAGAVATGGIISLLQALPLILSSIRSGIRDLSSTGGGNSSRRTESDLPLWFVGVGSLALVAAITMSKLMPSNLPVQIAGAVMIVLFGFLFVTVSSRLTGEIGSSSNPISGMTVATLLLTCFFFVLMGWVGPEHRLAALSIAGIVCIAASNGGTTSQDLKTGFLIGATPKFQQLAILIGALTSAIVIGATLLVLNNASTVITSKAEYLPTVRADVSTLTETTTHEGRPYHVWRVVNPIQGAQPGKYLVDDSGQAQFLVDPAINGRVNKRDDGSSVVKYDAPKATLMALIIDGIMTRKLPWDLVLIGVFIAILMHLAGVPALAFAVGVYLPLATSMPVFLGGLLHAAVDKLRKGSNADSDSSPAVLLSSGYIAGGTIAGILIAIVQIIPGAPTLLDLSARFPSSWNESVWPSLTAFGSMALALALVGLGVILKSDDPAAATQVEAKEENL
ncbi:OPT family oligopeptide transporter [Singulisphaera rosea]